MIQFVYSIWRKKKKKHNYFSVLCACTDQLMYIRGQSWGDKGRLKERESWREDVNGQRMLSVKTVHTNGAVLAEQGEDLWARCPRLL